MDEYRSDPIGAILSVPAEPAEIATQSTIVLLNGSNGFSVKTNDLNC